MLDAGSINYEANSLHTLSLVRLSLNNSNGVLLCFDENNPTILNDWTRSETTLLSVDLKKLRVSR